MKKGEKRIGFIPWNKGKKDVYSEEAKIRMRESAIKRGNNFPSQIGKKQTDETKKKMSTAKKGKRPKNYEQASKLAHEALLGTTLSIERRMQIADAHKGEKSHLWQGGLTEKSQIIKSSLEYRLWREKVFERDNYTCVWCGDNRGGNLNADHIKPSSIYPELIFDIDNGRTLCVDCHKKTDTYGYKSKRLKLEIANG